MPVLIRDFGTVMEERRKDTYLLQITVPENDFRPNIAGFQIAKDWLLARGVHFETVATLGEMCGDFGHRYIAFEDAADPNLIAWCEEFENADGGSKYPDAFQLWQWPWDQWVELYQADYLQYLVDIEDPDYEW
jgi:hypothetical protein